MPSENPVYVLYVDHQDHPAPLTCCFHATASRRLSSTLDRQHRPSTVTQVDSAFCPQCLSFHDASSASQLGYCPKPTCLQCPLCTSVLSIQKSSTEGDNCFFYKCGRCAWNSKQCQLTVPSTTEKPSKEEMVTAMAQLADALQARRTAADPDKSVEKHYRSLVNAWEDVVKPQHSSGRKILPSLTRRKEQDDGAWSVEALETSMQEKQKSWKQQTVDSVLGEGHELQRISLDDGAARVLDSSLQDLPDLSVVMQLRSVVSSSATSMSDLLPLPIPLRVRKSRRCRAELAEGRPGILIKPKLNPLEGDSSLRSGHGQWWKKDSSAIHVVPKVTVVRHESLVLDNDPNRRLHAFLLRVSNPTLGSVRLRLGVSRYAGEPFWDDDADSKQQKKRNPYMKELLVDTLTDKHVDVAMFVNTGVDDTKSDMVELESAEDAFVDMGKLREVPKEVMNWNAQNAVGGTAKDCDLDGTNALVRSIKLISKKSGLAWFEIVCEMSNATVAKDGGTDNSSDKFSAVPVSLEIQVGQGSWESSLIKANDVDEGQEPDTVTFDLLLAWPTSDT